MEQLLQNPSFEHGWDNVPVGATVNQIPAGWGLSWLSVNSPLLSAGAFSGDEAPVFEAAKTIPECIHKHSDQLPEDEQLGGAHALILDGEYVYKVFSAVNPFGVSLSQMVNALPGTRVQLTVPVQVHAHGDPSYGAAAARVCIDGLCSAWSTFGAGIEDHAWCEQTMIVTVPSDGQCLVSIDLESRALGGIDFFIDAVRFEVIAEPEPVEPPVDYVVVVELLPQDATLAEVAQAVAMVYAEKRSFVFSADDAVRLVAPGAAGSYVEVWGAERWADDIVAWLHARGVSDVVLRSFDGEPEPPEPEPGPTGYYIARGTKLGIHSIAPGGSPEYAIALAQAGAPVPVFKAVDDWGYIRLVKEASPSTLVIARHTMAFDGAGGIQDMTLGQIQATAAQYMEAYRQLLIQQSQYDGGQRLSYINYLELLNEADPPSARGYYNLALLFMAMLEIGEHWDMPVKQFAVSGMNAGTPEWDEMQAMADTGLLERICAGGHILTLHEAVLPFSDPIDKCWPGTIPGAPMVERAGALCGRYRFWLHIARERGLYLPVVISEFVSGPDYDPSHAADVIGRLAWYDELVRQDPEVWAFLPFTCGGSGIGWNQQDYSPFLAAFQQYALAVKDRQNAEP
jgi:hypothetical protein